MKLSQKKTLRLLRTVSKLKNAVVFYLLKNREERKIPKLKEMIELTIARQKQIIEEKRKRKERIQFEVRTAGYLDDD